FVEVERLRRPELRGRPVVVGGAGPRGVVASASYEARERGVRSAMPVARATRMAPGLTVVPPDHAEYRRVSALVFDILDGFTPSVERLSIDEAFLDVSGLRRHYDGAVEVAAAIRLAIRTELRLPASAGVAPNKLLAKLASEEAKPDGIRYVPAGGVQAFLHALPVGKLWGVGAATLAQLEKLGVATIGDLAAVPERTLERRLGATLGRHLHLLARGIDDRPVSSAGEAKSVSVEVTFDVDIVTTAGIEAELLRQSEQVAERLRRSGLSGRTITVKLRFSDFTTVTRSRSLESPTNVGRDVYRTARWLLQRSEVGERPVRLIGVGVSALESGTAPHQLATDRPPAWDDLADAVSSVRGRFGDGAVRPARLLEADLGRETLAG
ncbi:MAG: DNA polymerase IV, partial [Actinobacteria bacterium]|nr:DNA polymerase IV [Actinomycetota bacterium]NIU66385.1 DNA polymerase IV [Actinomycetota bacterium]